MLAHSDTEGVGGVNDAVNVLLLAVGIQSTKLAKAPAYNSGWYLWLTNQPRYAVH
jgi:hypothetical protein